ncbi:hypothetical protein [Chitinophaga sp. RAB17]|uniref:hypothetical protein n=1 Tax=Chitinophaga sp. RAB17 TaxID=3233049 RepID=UPI003F90D156
MKSLLITLFLVTAGMQSFTHAQVRPASRNETVNDGRNPIDFLFPDLQADLAKLQTKEIKSQPDKAIISTPIENRLFTNYKAPVVHNNSNARLLKTSATPSPMASDLSATDAANKLKAAKAAQTVKPIVIPNQGSEVNSAPVKKKS